MATTTSEKLIRCVIVTPEQTVLDTKAEGYLFLLMTEAVALQLAMLLL